MTAEFFNALIILTALFTGLGAGLMLAFSAAVMHGLDTLEPGESVRAMQAINRAVYNPVFMAAFVGPGLMMLAIGVLMLLTGGALGAAFSLATALYLVGVIGITRLGNIPLNNALDAVVSEDAAQASVQWRGYFTRWVRLNHIRTAFASLALVMLILAL